MVANLLTLVLVILVGVFSYRLGARNMKEKIEDQLMKVLEEHKSQIK